MLDQEATKKALEKFRRNVVKQARQNAQKKSSTGNLAKSITSKLNIHKQSFSLEFMLAKSKDGAPYGSFVDKGVSGKKKKYDTPYKYTNKMPPAKAFDKWTIKKGLAGRTKDGKFMSRKSLNFLIARSVFNNGIKPSLYFTKPFEKEFKKLPDVLATAYGLDVEEFVDDVIKENFK